MIRALTAKLKKAHAIRATMRQRPSESEAGQ